MKKNHRDGRLVREWILLAISLVDLATAIVNAVFNYQERHARKVDSPLSAKTRALGV